MINKIWGVFLWYIVFSDVVEGRLSVGTCTGWTASSPCIGTVPCSERGKAKNLIILHESERGEGLSDRATLVNGALIFGAALCARVLVPPPYMMLSSGHNNDKMIGRNWKWSRYWDMDSYYPRLLDWPQDVLPGTSKTKYRSLVVFDNQCKRGKKRCKNEQTFSLRKLLNQTEKRGYKITRNIKVALDMYIMDDPFALVAQMRDFYNHTVNRVEFLNDCYKVLNIDLKRRELNCSGYNRTYNRIADHVNLVPSPLVSKIANEIVANIGNYIIIHIRRTDVMNSKKYDPCDNSPPKVNALLTCIGKKLSINTFNDSFSNKGSFPSILFSTDETDEVYLDSVTSIMSQYSNQVIHLDNVTKYHMRALGYATDDNYLIYEVFLQIKLFHKDEVDVFYEFGGHTPDIAETCRQMTQC